MPRPILGLEHLVGRETDQLWGLYIVLQRQEARTEHRGACGEESVRPPNHRTQRRWRFLGVTPLGCPGALQQTAGYSSVGPDISAHRVRNVGFSIKVQAMGPEGARAQMSFYIFMWNVITFGHDGGGPVTAIRVFMVLKGIGDCGGTCLQVKATGCADARSYLKSSRTHGWG